MKSNKSQSPRDLTLWILAIGAAIFTLCFGLTLLLVKQEISRWGEKQAELTSNYIETYVVEEMRNVETAAFTMAGGIFSYTFREQSGDAAVEHDLRVFKLPSEEEIFQTLERFLDANPQICGVALGFENDITGYDHDEFGTACYVTNINGTLQRLHLGQIHDFHQKEWYMNGMKSGKGQWSLPFRETSNNRVVTCFSMPVEDIHTGRKFGVLAFDINTEIFRKRCDGIAPFPGAEISIIDRENKFVSQLDTTLLLKSVTESPIYADVFAGYDPNGTGVMSTLDRGDSIYYLTPISHNGWTICTMFPKKALYASMDTMRHRVTLIAIFGILFMAMFLSWLFRKIQKISIQKAGMESELGIASRIQLGMLQKECPESCAGYDLDIATYLHPTKDVGGDLYDYLARDGKLFFCIGDVSGKGIPASLFMAETLALFRNAAAKYDSPSEIISSMNRTLSFNNSHNMFCTAIVGVIDIKSGILRYCNAGHNYPIIGGKFIKSKPEIVLGVMEDIPYSTHETPFAPDECILLYTDGVTEAENLTKAQFGDERLLAASAKASNGPDIVENVKKAVMEFRGNANQNDDITLMAIRYHR